LIEKYIEIPIAQLIKADWNYKDDDLEKAQVLKRQIIKNGQLENLIVREMGNGIFEVINGNHRLDTFRELGYKAAVCFNHGQISKAQAVRLAVETNETTFQADEMKLARAIQNLKTTFDDIEQTMPFSQERFEAMERSVNANWGDIIQQHESAGAGEKPKAGTFCPGCHKKIKIVKGKIYPTKEGNNEELD
jgi:hypothetical protein